MIGKDGDLLEDNTGLLGKVGRTLAPGGLKNDLLEQKGELSGTYYRFDDIEGISYIKDELIRGSNRIGELVMEAPLPPWGVVVLEGPSVGSARSAFFKARSNGAALFRVPFDTFGPRGTPESRARFGVQIVQIASLLKNFSIASLRPEYYGGSVSERVLPESYRLNYLKTIASQGFAWIEVEQTVRNDRMREIVSDARKAGSKIMLTCRLEEMIEWSPPGDIPDDMFDGYKILVPVKDGSGLRRMIRASINARKWLGGKALMVEPFNGNLELPRIINALSLSDMVDIGMDEIDNSPEVDLRDRGSIWNSLGITGAGMAKEWSLSKRMITPETMLYLQMGKTRGNTFRTWIFNTQFNRLGLDGAMIPWECGNPSVVDSLDMAKRMDVKGLMVEMPLRGSMVGKMDWVDPRSRAIGSIDVVVINKGKANGYNSEIYGIADQIAFMKIEKDSSVLVLGTGASGRAAAVAAAMMGMRTYLAGTSMDRTKALVEELPGTINATSFRSVQKPGTSFNVIINSIPFESRSVKGMANQTMEIADMVKSMRPDHGMDLYSRMPWTPFLAAVESTGATAVPGSELLVRNSLRAFRLLTGKDGSRDCITNVMEQVHFHKPV